MIYAKGRPLNIIPQTENMSLLETADHHLLKFDKYLPAGVHSCIEPTEIIIARRILERDEKHGYQIKPLNHD